MVQNAYGLLPSRLGRMEDKNSYGKSRRASSSARQAMEKEEREHKAEALAAKAQELFPAAKITPLPNAVVPSVMIEQEPPDNASDAVKALGGELRITYRLEP